MAYVAVDKDSQEGIHQRKPTLGSGDGFWYTMGKYTKRGEKYIHRIALPKGSIEKLIGRKLTWEDEPVELRDE